MQHRDYFCGFYFGWISYLSSVKCCIKCYICDIVPCVFSDGTIFTFIIFNNYCDIFNTFVLSQVH